LYHNTVGHNLVAIGDGALYNQRIGTGKLYQNVAVGSKALFSNTTGWGNIAIGFAAITNNTTGEENTIGWIPVNGKQYNRNANNTSVGFRALTANTNEWGNTAIGCFAMFGAKGGNQITCLGMESDAVMI
jgi:hypothetical protein